jgi:hypothetical protein
MLFRTTLSVVALSTALAGCGGSAGPTPGGKLDPAQQAARLALVKGNAGLNDVEMAHLCPALYPKDVQKAVAIGSEGTSAAAKSSKDTLKKYRFDTQKVRVKSFTGGQLAQAKAARCGTPIPIAAAVPSTTKK